MSERRDLAERFADILFRYQKLWLAISVALTLGLGFFIKDLRIDNSVEVLFQKTSPIVQAYKKFTRIFGNAELAVIAFRDERGVFHPEVLDEIEHLTNDILTKVPHVENVISLTNVQVLDRTEDGFTVRPIVETTPDPLTTDAGRHELVKRAQEEPFIRRTLVSDDGTTTSLVVKTVYLEGNQTYRQELTNALRELLEPYREKYGTEYYLGGPPVFLTYFDEYILQDMLTFGPLTVLIMFVILFLTFRSWIGIVLPMGVVAIGAIWTVGFMGAMGFPITLATTIIPPLLFVIGLEDAIYILSFFRKEAIASDDAFTRARNTAAHTNIACFLTSITTAIGFGSLMITDINAVYETGMVSAVGSMAVWASNNIILPLVLQWIPYNVRDEETEEKLEHGLLQRFLDKLLEWNLAHPWAVLMFGLAVAAAFIPGMMHLKVETNFVKYFREETPIYQAQQFIQKNLSGVAPLEILVDTHEPDGMLNPDVLHEMDDIERVLREDPIVDWSFGTQDFFELMHKYVADDPSQPITDPALLSQYILLYQISGGGAGLEDFLDTDRQYGRISARLQDQPTSVLKHTLGRVQARMDETTSGATYQFADNTAMLVSIVDAMLLNTAESLLIASVVIFLLIWIYVRSALISLLFMIPNLIPVGAVLGVMGYTGVELNISTMMIGAVAIGLAVNNTIHIFAHFPRSLVHANGDLDEAAHETMHTVGRAAVSAGVALLAGFAVLSFSYFYPNVYFGALSAFTMVIALVCDLTISYTFWILLGKRGYRGPAHMQKG
ncbi:MAG: hypothetical protein D6761_07125 [Candidatus Dadabacteria bacterium]|nr:MAG: hypothetical protein D6761_07125 [Candidatus Dadabacteria bacterium]